MNTRSIAGLALASTPILYYIGFTLSEGYGINWPLAALGTALYAGGAYLILTTEQRK